jgi:hypothetical protein
VACCRPCAGPARRWPGTVGLGPRSTPVGASVGRRRWPRGREEEEGERRRREEGKEGKRKRKKEKKKRKKGEERKEKENGKKRGGKIGEGILEKSRRLSGKIGKGFVGFFPVFRALAHFLGRR